MKGSMLSRPVTFAFAALAAGTLLLPGLRFAVAEPASVDVGTLSREATNTGLLTKAELDALKARLEQHWNPPAEARVSQEELTVLVRIALNPNGTFASPPMVLTRGAGELYFATRDSAVVAVFRSQPFNMLLPASYESWKQIDITFNPHGFVR